MCVYSKVCLLCSIGLTLRFVHNRIAALTTVIWDMPHVLDHVLFSSLLSLCFEGKCLLPLTMVNRNLNFFSTSSTSVLPYSMFTTSSRQEVLALVSWCWAQCWMEITQSKGRAQGSGKVLERGKKCERVKGGARCGRNRYGWRDGTGRVLLCHILFSTLG